MRVIENIYRIVVALFIFGAPLLGVYFVYRSSAIDYPFDAGANQATPATAKDKILQSLAEREDQIKFIDPFIQINSKWFRYNGEIENRMRLAITATEPSYSEHDTILTLQSERGTETIPYGQSKSIGENLKKEQILDRIENFGFLVVPTTGILSAPGSQVQIQHSPLLGSAYVHIRLTKSRLSFFFVYMTFWIFITGVITLLKESFLVIAKGLKYFRS